MRLNLSHTTLSASDDYIRAYQAAAQECGKQPQILIDMQGPELRVGRLEEAIQLVEQEVIHLVADSKDEGLSVNCGVVDSLTCDSGTEGRVDMEDRGERCIPIPPVVIDAASIGDIILLDDGKLQLEVVEIVETESVLADGIYRKSLRAKVLRGGLLQSHKSIKIEGRHIPMPVLTEHDLANIKLAKSYGVTALMQPFVLSGEDLRYVRKVLEENHAEDISIFAKIENRMGVENLDSILPEADVIVIARGDLGNDMPLWELPAVQKQIENKCKEHNKPYIVVTQMLASMEEHPLPTRAEVSDIFHAVYHGAWGVMITGESAIGKYPVEAVKYLARTAESVFSSGFLAF